MYPLLSIGEDEVVGREDRDRRGELRNLRSVHLYYRMNCRGELIIYFLSLNCVCYDSRTRVEEHFV